LLLSICEILLAEAGLLEYWRDDQATHNQQTTARSFRQATWIIRNLPRHDQRLDLIVKVWYLMWGSGSAGGKISHRGQLTDMGAKEAGNERVDLRGKRRLGCGYLNTCTICMYPVSINSRYGAQLLHYCTKVVLRIVHRLQTVLRQDDAGKDMVLRGRYAYFYLAGRCLGSLSFVVYLNVQ
jgi:hypothetical protein